MKRSLLIVSLIAFAAFPVAGQPTVAGLSARVRSGDAAAFQQVLKLAETTPPGESLENLAEISSHFVLINPTEFLRAQTLGKPCFGVSFMGPDFVDNSAARAHERSLRRAALESVPQSSLAAVKQQCLAELL